MQSIIRSNQSELLDVRVTDHAVGEEEPQVGFPEFMQVLGVAVET
jgi:hypothetical protein